MLITRRTAPLETTMALLEIESLLTHEVTGPPDAPGVLVLGGISASRHVTSTADDPSPGWWQQVVGDDRAVDTRRWRVIGADHLDGGARPDGRPDRVVTTASQADAIAQLLDELGVQRLHALVGASYGGMVALAFAERHPDRVERLVVIGAAHESHPMTTAVRTIQRRIVELGLDTGRASEAMAIARSLAMTSYRSRREFGERFRGAGEWSASPAATFPVEHYLRHHGERFAAAFTPARFLALSLSADLHSVRPEAIRTPTMLVAADDDAVVPREQVDELSRRIGAPVRVGRIATITGHDAFLTETTQVASLLHTALHAPEFP